MKLFLDTEFNGLGGDLISMALVSDRGAEWYCVVSEPRVWDAWAYENVFPHLGEEPVGVKAFEHSLEAFLLEADGAEIYADWPADFGHLSDALTAISARRGYRLLLTCSMHLIESGELRPAVPHNALSDARALRDWHMGLTIDDSDKSLALLADECRLQSFSDEPQKPGDDVLWW